MKAVIYDRTSAADLGRTVHDDDRLPALARHVAARGWELAGTHWDNDPSPNGQRPGLQQMLALPVGSFDVLVVGHLHAVCRDVRNFLQLTRELAQRGVALVATKDVVDSTGTGEAKRAYDLAMLMLHRLDHARRSEIARAGIVTHAVDPQTRRRRLVVINALEVKQLWESGLSQREMLAELKARKCRVGLGTLNDQIRRMLESGELNQAARDAAIVARGGIRKGGRPRKVRRSRLPTASTPVAGPRP